MYICMCIHICIPVHVFTCKCMYELECVALYCSVLQCVAEMICTNGRLAQFHCGVAVCCSVHSFTVVL